MESFEKINRPFSRWHNEEYEKYLNKFRDSIHKEERKEYLRKAEEILMEEIPVIPLYCQNNIYLCKKKVKNVYSPRFNYTDFKWADIHSP